jgi:hypothetical protein
MAMTKIPTDPGSDIVAMICSCGAKFERGNHCPLGKYCFKRIYARHVNTSACAID